jgi:endonuclease YncB( thermonuclease family)
LAKVIKVYDGDTITVNIYYCKNVFEYQIRLARIDTPELKYKGLNKDTENSDDPRIIELKKLRESGFKAKSRLEQLIAECPDNLIYIDCLKKEKFGRILGEVYPTVVGCCFATLDRGKKSFNQILLDENLAKPYNGGNRDVD